MNNWMRRLGLRSAAGSTGMVVMALGLLSLLGCSSKSEDHLARAIDFAKRRNFDAAVIEYKNALEIAPNAAEPRRQFGELYVKLGDGKSGYKELSKAVEFGIDPSVVEPSMIRALLLQGSVAPALERAGKLNAAKPSPESALLLGYAQFASEDLASAEKNFKAVLEKQPASAEAHCGLGRIETNRGNYAAASTLFEQALKSDPQSVDVRLGMAELKMLQGDGKRALEEFTEATKLNPYLPGAQVGRLRAYLLLKDTKGANSALEILRRRAPNNVMVNYYQGTVDFLDGKNERARDAFRKVLSAVPNHPYSQYYLAALLVREGKLEQAEEMIRGAIKSLPDTAQARVILAKIQLARGSAADALETLATFGDKLNQDSQLAALAGNAHLARGDTQKGIAMLARASELAPGDPSLKAALVTSQVRYGQSSQSVEALENELRTQGDSQYTELLLLYAQMQRREWDKAIEQATASLAKRPGDTSVLNALGLAYMGKKDAPNARIQFEKILQIEPRFAVALQNLSALDIEAGDWPAARRRAQQLLEFAPHNATALTVLGRAALRGQDTEGAIKYFEQARSADVRALDARLQLSSLYLEKQNIELAKVVASEAVVSAPDNALALVSYGNVALAAGDLAEVSRVAEAAEKLAPGLPQARYLTAMASISKKDYPAAEKQLVDLAKKAPDDAKTLTALAGLLLKRGDVRRAREYVDRLKGVEGLAAVAYALSGDIASQENDFAAAADAYDQALHREYLPEYAIKRMVARQRAGALAKGLDETRELLEKHPSDHALGLALAGGYQAAGQDNEALAAYENILKNAPKSAVALNNLALLKEKQGAPDAVDLASRAFELAGDQPAIADTYGWLLIKRGQVEKSIQALERAANLASDQGEILYHYAVALAKSGQERAALAQLDKALKLQNIESRTEAQALRGILADKVR